MRCYINGIIHPMTEESLVYHSIATNQGVIVHIDDHIDLKQCESIVDLKGNHLYPGFVDAHLHLLGYGEHLSTLNVSSCHTKEALFELLDQHLNKPFVFAQGYIDIGITKHDLDKRYKDQMILLRHNDFHGLTLNQKALDHFNVSDETGILKELKAQHVLDLIPKHSKEELSEMLKKALEKLYHYGITGGHSDDLFYYNGFDETYSVFEDVLKTHPFRTHLLMHHEVIDDFIKSKKSWGVQNPYLELGGVKMFYDGTMSSQTALMKDPYLKSSHHGEVVMGKDFFENTLIKTRSHGLTAAIHVIGDQGLDDVCELLLKHPPRQGFKDRIIHAPWLMKKTLPKLIDKPLTIDIQPPFLASDLPRAYTLFSKKPEYEFPWKTYLDHQIIISGSSDAPVEDPNPLIGIKDAIFRRSREDMHVYQKEESLSSFEAIKLYSTYAHAQSIYGKKGYIKEGYVADFTVLDLDLMHAHEHAFNGNHVVMTIIDDVIVYTRKL
ncbi:MAG: hypothetical protein A2Y45_10040 [Tenericutes bacterium GWC2_34_14]|nr:MAG: hypothetical protein A2Z84_01130 [Tenericutes bacterium GWA2_35_7]OHE28915.1 MAG: hypothetical protein A2Y45_10040 [Tenericutes bacterium GWC2_34_14]OHE33874.1 MAG: hypothetical protein A2012_07170 [Tenericutes bacterium GWE2_34_108]OHE36609.1 MAG: hypothetical protein A2Y46_03980 [Tenericutes bacterium GWF1_35_14]OHE37815.1 MAG: hypothetical protein A2Y44_05300 [Tenericutes bacterium GWF2_35_184]OHE45270.1 MAG: hypothetical protein A2221_07665 [Tenericutes bacterium RIFOXYA2_FULL_36_3